MPGGRTPKIEALVVNAIRRLQDIQGSSSREISNYISQEYDVPVKDIRRQVQLVLQRGLSYGILQQTKGGYYTCNRDHLAQIPVEDEAGDGVTEPCPHGDVGPEDVAGEDNVEEAEEQREEGPQRASDPIRPEAFRKWERNNGETTLPEMRAIEKAWNLRTRDVRETPLEIFSPPISPLLDCPV
ncbi:PREDICTED: uncharacterized protein LOC106749304 [Dinoponera quadriceps]|uniref:Uncharacterized protein LOC106749304 n=1 Tax=Dinoponera quadriceps TaxID=609295 RepID=A0A6P3Y1E0_DINQU|nr:PREDICTED: uncharacterized protein LOC106749304 [Dinoponera quadriceps]